jgi:hypothetical protein
LLDSAPTAPSAKPKLLQGHGGFDKELSMLETIAIILVVLWLVGLVTSTTMGGLIHVLLVIAIVVVLVRVISGRRL